MIVRWHGEDLLVDQEAATVDRAMAGDGGLSRHTVRARLAGQEVACDVRTRAPLYEHEHATAVLAAVRPRPGRSAARLRARRSLVAI